MNDLYSGDPDDSCLADYVYAASDNEFDEAA